MDKVGDELFWCQGGGKVPLQVNGSTLEPFFLVSLAGPNPNLNAVPLNSKVRISKVYCIYDASIKEKCDSGNRSSQPSLFENILSKYKFDSNFFNGNN